MALQIRRGPTADRITKKFSQGELIFDTSINEVFIGDSTDGVNGTLGGRPVTSFTSDQAKDAAASIFDNNPDHENITFSYDPVTKKITASVPDDVAGIFNVADDLTPELGGNLSLNGKIINGTGSISITGGATFTAKVETSGDIEATGTGRLKGSLIGSMRSSNGTVIINNGTDGTDAVFTGSLQGNALTATNGVVTTGTYANPSWITSLAGSKVTDAVLTTGTYADPSWITSLAGSKVTNAVLTTGSYADPSWITSLAGNKITGNISSDNIVEGTNNQFYTDAKARLAISSGLNISYNSLTGQISLSSNISSSGNATFNEITASFSLASLVEFKVVRDAPTNLYSLYADAEISYLTVPLRIGVFTTTERDALRPELKVPGLIIFNSTLQKTQSYVNDVGLATTGVSNSTAGWVNYTVTAA